MNRHDFSTTAATATGLVQGLGAAAHGAIDLWRAGGQRLGEVADARWNEALRESSPRLSAQTRRNAVHAKEVVGRYYRRGMALSASGAQLVVDTAVQAATAAIARAEALRRARSGTAA